ncbi:AI-2E family transporter [Massilia sp. LXY-6]|uniref:AI-2E family transporter n=1 Tax=Massilia sp. LXY-6 TaxID=3379823 RepID=UPI003EE2328E
MNDQDPTPPAGDAATPTPVHRRLMRRFALVDGIAALFLALLAGIYYAANALLLVFACILFAIFLYELSAILCRRFHINRKLGLVIVVVLLLLMIGLGGWAMAPRIAEQANQLAKEIPASLQRLQQMVEHHPLLRRIASELPQPKQLMQYLGRMAPDAGLFFGGVLGAIANIAIILFVGIYFALSPRRYIDGFIKLVPPRKRERAGQVLDEIGGTLARWLLGTSCSMLIAGTATSIGLSLLGVPLALILGIIAGLLDFIPYLGPIMAGVPAVLIALSVDPQLALYTTLLFLGIQMMHGYVMQPMIDSWAVSLPPALIIVMQLVFGTIFGFAGIALATPLTASLMLLVKMLYVQDILGDRDEDKRDS